MEKGFTSEDAEETVPLRLCVCNELGDGVDVQFRALSLNIDPTALAAQVARIQDRDVEKSRKVFSSTNARFKTLDADQSLDPEVPKKLQETFGIRR